jgi:hypothetical protein
MKKMKKQPRPADPFRVRRELTTHEQRVTWLLHFANQRDVEKLTPSEVDKLGEHLFEFAAKGEDTFVWQGESLTAAALYKIQDQLRSGLRQAIRLDDSKVHGFVGWETSLDGVTRRVSRGRSGYQGSPQATFLGAVSDLIVEDREKRFEICVRPTCERFFWKRGGSKYCSKQCADADRQKRWRNKEEKSR